VWNLTWSPSHTTVTYATQHGPPRNQKVKQFGHFSSLSVLLVHYRAYKGSPPAPVLRKINPLHNLTSNISKVPFISVINIFSQVYYPSLFKRFLHLKWADKQFVRNSWHSRCITPSEMIAVEEHGMNYLPIPRTSRYHVPPYVCNHHFSYTTVIHYRQHFQSSCLAAQDGTQTCLNTCSEISLKT
jgi:hypothetical protein